MPRTCLIGYSGFVGSNLASQFAFDDLFRSTNIAEIAGQTYDLLVCSGVSAAKWIANRDPQADRASIDGLLSHLALVKSARTVLISTVDVYPQASGVDESFDCSNAPNHAYGTNRLYVEEQFRHHFGNVHVVRLPALFGPGLKKNVIYDLLHDNCLDVINPDSSFQYYDMTAIWADVQTVLQHALPLVNMPTEPVVTRTIVERFFPGVAVGTKPAPTAAYDIHTRYAGIFGEAGHYRFRSAEVLERLGRYIDSARPAPHTI